MDCAADRCRNENGDHVRYKAALLYSLYRCVGGVGSVCAVGGGVIVGIGWAMLE